ncbi:MAG: hypothetical protein RIR56_805, partial [Bacteroidota bacterium]
INDNRNDYQNGENDKNSFEVFAFHRFCLKTSQI